MDLRKDKSVSMQDSRYSLSSIIILETRSVSSNQHDKENNLYFVRF
jgi:hypothetical protein